MLKTDVFKRSESRCVQICKSLNFHSVDTLSAQLHTNSTHLPYSSFARNFEFSSLFVRILRSTKSQKSSKKVGGHPHLPPRFATPALTHFIKDEVESVSNAKVYTDDYRGVARISKKFFFWSFLTF